MANFSRYSRAPLLNLGTQLGTSRAIEIIRNAVNNGDIPVREIVLRGAERLDTLAGSIYGDGRLWWVISSASGIGWFLQAPPGTLLKIPELSDIAALIG